MARRPAQISKLFVPTGGGLGDVVRVYFKEEPHWGYLKSIKELYPDTKIKILSSCHTPQVEEFFKHNPYIDKFQEFGWIVDGNPLVQRYRQGHLHISNAIKHYGNSIKWEQPVLHVSKEDIDIVNEIVTNSNGIITMHPFAIRSAMPIDEFHHMTNRLIDEFGYTVVYLGATYNRYHNLNLEPSFTFGGDMIEESDFERPGLFNLLNKSNCRVGYRLIEICDGFIGHCSCFNIAAWIHAKKSVVFSPPDQRPLLSTHRSYAWPLIDHLPWCKNFYSDEWISPRDAANHTVEFFRR